jgi:hypothetical protein
MLQILALAKFSDFLVKTRQAKKFCPASHASGARVTSKRELPAAEHAHTPLN